MSVGIAQSGAPVTFAVQTQQGKIRFFVGAGCHEIPRFRHGICPVGGGEKQPRRVFGFISGGASAQDDLHREAPSS